MNDYYLCETFNFVFNNSLAEILIFTIIFNEAIIYELKIITILFISYYLLRYFDAYNGGV